MPAGAIPLLARGASGLGRTFVAERARWILWLPVLEGLGIGGYFACLDEPPWWLGATAMGLLSAVLAAGRYRFGGRSWWPAARLAAIAALAVASGFCAAQAQTWWVRAPVLTAAAPPLRFQGTVADIEALPQGCRIVLEDARVEALEPARTPRRIRLKTRDCPAAIGDRLGGRALLFPIPAPLLPGGYDFQRQSYFQGLGATGFTIGRQYEYPGPATRRPDALVMLRHAMTARIMAVLPGAEGGVAAALITGEKTGIPPEVAQDFRDSGLAHMLVIAGLHMTLVAGFVFFACRAALALIPAVALRHPIKKFAALAALAVALIYLAISGSAVPTQRAFIMCGLGILAILADRAVFSMRGLALAALVVLTIDPVALMGVSFQMSFAAVVALIAFYETFSAQLSGLRLDAGPVRRAGLHLFGIALTTVVATIGTLPFTIYHFGRFALYSVLANVVAVPLAGIWILPWGFIACLLMPLHLEAVALVPMGWGIRVVERVAHWTASLPDDVMLLPAMPPVALLAISLGGLWITLWSGRWRVWGMVPVLAGLASLALVTPPDVFVAGDGRLVAIRSADDRLYLSSTRRERMAAENWQAAAALRGAIPLPDSGAIAARRGVWVCDADACVWRGGSDRVTLLRNRRDDDAPCPDGNLILSVYTLPTACAGHAGLRDPSTAASHGAETIWLDTPIIVRSAAVERGVRPWIPSQ